MPEHLHEADLTHVRPYGDQLGDGVVQLSFTLPVPHGPAARKTALALAAQLGLARPEVVHHQRLLDGYTHFLVYGEFPGSVDYTLQRVSELDAEYLSEDEIDGFASEHVGRPIVVVGACDRLGHAQRRHRRDARPQGLPGQPRTRRLPRVRCAQPRQPGPQRRLVARAIELGADAILVSQTVTQQDLHIRNLTELVEVVEAEGIRERTILACGGSRVSNELAKELGFDAGFSRGTYPHHLASFLVREVAARQRDEVAA